MQMRVAIMTITTFEAAISQTFLCEIDNNHACYNSQHFLILLSITGIIISINIIDISISIITTDKKTNHAPAALVGDVAISGVGAVLTLRQCNSIPTITLHHFTISIIFVVIILTLSNTLYQNTLFHVIVVIIILPCCNDLSDPCSHP